MANTTLVSATVGKPPASEAPMLLTALRWAVTHLFNFVHTSKFAKPLTEILGFVLAACLGIAIYHHFVPKITVTQLEPTVKVVTVDKPILTNSVITKILSDPKDKAAISALLAENKADKLAVEQLTQALATLQQTGSGVVVAVPPDKPGEPISYHYKDWHLDFLTDTKTANYTLSQNFEVLTSTGRDKNGQAGSLVKVFEIGANGERIPMKVTNTVAIIANPLSPHWMVHANVQGGIAAGLDSTGTETTGATVGFQWFKHGSTTATQDISYAILTPVILLAPKVVDAGLAPVQFNLGTLPHQPFTNLWVSPFPLGLDWV